MSELGKVVFLDCETTGLDPLRHVPWQIGLIEQDGTEHEWWLPIMHQQMCDADPGALRVNRYHERLVERIRKTNRGNQGFLEYESVKSIALKFCALTSRAHLVGNVPSFDAGFTVFMIAYTSSVSVERIAVSIYRADCVAGGTALPLQGAGV